jgi:hypothetical protein
MKRWKFYALLLFSLSALSLHAEIIDLGVASNFAVLAGTTVTNTGATVISGNVGVNPGTAITGFPPAIITNGAQHSADALAGQAQIDAHGAYLQLADLPLTQTLTGTDLGGLTLTPGVYFFGSSAQLTGTLTLDAQNNPNALFVFQVGSTLTTASDSSVLLINGANCCNIFWQVGSSATLGTDTNFRGTVLALTSITLNTGADIAYGRALAYNGAVTLDSNTIFITPEPGTVVLLGAGLVGLILLGRRSRKRAA